jgi:hypothetical protein
MLANPWFLASEPFIEAVRGAGLTGLRVGAVARVAFSDEFRRLLDLGEMIRPSPPVFRIVVPERRIEVDGLGHELSAEVDDLRYAGPPPEDFSYTDLWGPVLTERALEIVHRFARDRLALWRIRPAQ